MLATRLRVVFGDERDDYGAALQRHYRSGPPSDWQQNFVSAYATAHPWEDFAETWAHYLHIVDSVEMARSFGVSVAPAADRTGAMQADVEIDPYRATSMDEILAAWVPLTFALNSLSRCMGQPDLYPFVLPPPVSEKLAFIHSVVQRTG